MKPLSLLVLARVATSASAVDGAAELLPPEPGVRSPTAHPAVTLEQSALEQDRTAYVSSGDGRAAPVAGMLVVDTGQLRWVLGLGRDGAVLGVSPWRVLRVP